MNLGKLIIFSGLPGSGKSTLAARLSQVLGATYVRIDTIEQGLRDICGISEIDGKGYELAHRIAGENLRWGNNVVADSVNPWGLTRRGWNRVAEDVGASFVNVEVVCSDKSEHRMRVEGRAPTIPGLKNPTWDEVLQRDYHAWNGERHVIDTFGKSVETSLHELLSVLDRSGIRRQT